VRVSAVFLFYFHVILTGVAIAAATTYFAAMVGAPAPRVYPVVREDSGMAGPLLLWLLAGPIALMRLVVRPFQEEQPASFLSSSSLSMGALIAALVWAFCLGVIILELIFRLFAG